MIWNQITEISPVKQQIKNFLIICLLSHSEQDPIHNETCLKKIPMPCLYNETCPNQTSLGPTFVFGINRCSVYADWIKKDFIGTLFKVLYKDSVLFRGWLRQVSVPREGHRHVASHWHTKSHNVVSITHHHG
jgi:hypothetical protein